MPDEPTTTTSTDDLCWAAHLSRCLAAWGAYRAGGSKLQLLADLADSTASLASCLDGPTGAITGD